MLLHFWHSNSIILSTNVFLWTFTSSYFSEFYTLINYSNILLFFLFYLNWCISLLSSFWFDSIYYYITFSLGTRDEVFKIILFVVLFDVSIFSVGFAAIDCFAFSFPSVKFTSLFGSMLPNSATDPVLAFELWFWVWGYWCLSLADKNASCKVFVFS